MSLYRQSCALGFVSNDSSVMQRAIMAKAYTSRKTRSSHHYAPKQAGSDVVRDDQKGRRNGFSSLTRTARLSPRPGVVLLSTHSHTGRPAPELPAKSTSVAENYQHVEAVKQCLQSLEDKLIADDGDDRRDVMDDWMSSHAADLFPGIGVRAIAVPPTMISSHRLQALESCSLCQVSEACPATFFGVHGQESDQKGRQALNTVFAAFQLLNEALEREGQTTMFVMANVHSDNILAWLTRGKQREKSIEDMFPNVFSRGSYISVQADRHVDDMIVVYKDTVLLIQVKAVGSSDSSNRPELIQKSLHTAIKQLRQGRALFNSLVTRPRDRRVLLVVATPMVSRADVLGAEPAADEEVHFLCRDDLFTDDIKISERETDTSRFRGWWSKLVSAGTEYDVKDVREIVGKYVGLLSTPVVIKKGNEHHLYRYNYQMVNKTREEFARQIITAKQIKALRALKDEKLVYLSGPEASGKRQVMIYRAHQFASANPDNYVVVVTTSCGGWGSCVGTVLEETLKGSFPDQVKAVALDASYTDTDFKSKIEGVLYEIKRAHSIMFIIVNMPQKIFSGPIVTSLRSASPGCEIWCEGVFSEKPEGFREFPMDAVLRCPPAVQRLLYHVDWKEERKSCYVTDPANLEVATKGPIPLCVRHECHVPQVSAIDCSQCANDLVAILEELGIKTQDPRVKYLSEPTNPDYYRREEVAAATRRLSGFEVPVVLLVNVPRALCRKKGRSPYVERRTQEKFMARVQESLLVRTLREKGLQAAVKVRLSCNDLDEVRHRGALLTTWVYNFIGLEGGVVIYLPGDEAVKAGTEKTAATCIYADRAEREIPAPGVHDGEMPDRLERSHGEVAADQDGWNSFGQERASSRAWETREMKCKHVTARAGDRPSMSARYWRRRELDRFSEWDKTGILLAGSSCLAQLILIVP